MPLRQPSSRKTSKTMVLVVLLLIGFSLYLFQQLTLIRQSMDSIVQSIGGLIDESGKKIEGNDELVAFGQDLNEIRRFLYLPAKNYDFQGNKNVNASNGNTNSGDEQEDTLSPLLFQYVDKLDETVQKKKEIETARTAFENLVQGADIKPLLSAKSIVLSPLKELDTEFLFEASINKSALSTFVLAKENRHFFIKDVSGIKEYETSDLFASGLKSYIENIDQLMAQKNKVDQIQKDIDAIIQQPALKQLLEEKKLTYTASEFKNKEGNVLIKAAADGEKAQYAIMLNGNKQFFVTKEEFEKVLTESLKSIDSGTAIEKEVEQKKKELSEVFASEAFQDVLKSKGLRIATEPAYETDRIYFHITDAENARIASIIIERGSGEVKVVDGQGLNPATLEDFLSGQDEKKKP